MYYSWIVQKAAITALKRQLRGSPRSFRTREKSKHYLRIDSRTHVPTVVFEQLRRTALVRLRHASELADRAFLR